MKNVLLALMLVAPLAAQVGIQFHPQPASVSIGSLSQYEVAICNAAAETQTVYGMAVWKRAKEEGIAPATHASILAESQQIERRSWTYYLGLGVKIASGVGTVATTTGAVKFGDAKLDKAIQTAIPAIGIGVQLAESFLKDEQVNPSVEIPYDKLVPATFQVGGNACVDYLLYGTPGDVPVASALPLGAGMFTDCWKGKCLSAEDDLGVLSTLPNGEMRMEWNGTVPRGIDSSTGSGVLSIAPTADKYAVPADWYHSRTITTEEHIPYVEDAIPQ